MMEPEYTDVLACTLNDAEFRERRALGRRTFKESVTNQITAGNRLTIQFVQSENLRQDLLNFIELEQQCCGLLSFTITPEVNDRDVPIMLLIDGPPGSEETINMFRKIMETLA